MSGKKLVLILMLCCVVVSAKPVANISFRKQELEVKQEDLTLQETLESDKSSIYNEEKLDVNDFVYPTGLDTKLDVIDWAIKDSIIFSSDNMDTLLNVEDYVKLMEFILDNHDMPILKTDGNIANSRMPSDIYKKLNDKGYLSLFSKEEIENNDPLTLNHITRMMSSVMDFYKPYEEVDESLEEFFLSQVNTVSTSDKECRKKKVIHLMRANMLPTTYTNDFPLDRQLTKFDFTVIMTNLLDGMRLYSPKADAEGCLPCQKEEIRNERNRGE